MNQISAGVSSIQRVMAMTLLSLSLAACKLGKGDEDRPLPSPLEPVAPGESRTNAAAPRSAPADERRAPPEARRPATTALPSPAAPAPIQTPAPTGPDAAAPAPIATAPTPSTGTGGSQPTPTGSVAIPAELPQPNSACVTDCQKALASCLAATDGGLPTLATVTACQNSAVQCQSSCI